MVENRQIGNTDCDDVKIKHKNATNSRYCKQNTLQAQLASDDTQTRIAEAKTTNKGRKIDQTKDLPERWWRHVR